MKPTDIPACEQERFDVVFGLGAAWRDRSTGYSYLHDFEPGVPLAQQLQSVREKYARRAAKVLELIRRARRMRGVMS